MSLKKQAIAGMIWSYAQQLGTQLIAFLVSIVLSRILLPEEFGLIGMLAIFMGIGSALFNGGLASSLIRTQDCTQKDYSTVFYFNLVGSVIVYFILFFSATQIAIFFNQPLLKDVTRVYGVTFILSAFGTVQNTILTKEMKFKKQALLSLPALIISSAVGLLMALNNFGVWSLVGSALSNAFLTSLFLWFSTTWKPSLIFSKEKFKEHFHFGYKLTISSILDTIFTNIYQILIGKFYSAALVGHYTRANQLMMLPVGNVSGALQKVVYPLFAKVQDDVPRFRKAYKQIMLMVLFVITPIMVLMGVLAQPLIVFLFSEKWLPAVPIFQIICFTGILYPLHLYNLVVLQVKGRSDLYLKLEIMKKVLLSVVLIVSFFYGFYALLWGQLVFSILALLINTYYAGVMLDYSTLSQLRDVAPVFVFGIVTGLAVYGINFFINDLNVLIRLISGSILGLSVYGGIAWLFKFQSISDIKNLIFKR